MSFLTKLLNVVHISKFSFYFLIILIITSFSITFYLLLPNNQLVKDPQNLQFLLLVDVIFNHSKTFVSPTIKKNSKVCLKTRGH